MTGYVGWDRAAYIERVGGAEEAEAAARPAPAFSSRAGSLRGYRGSSPASD